MPTGEKYGCGGALRFGRLFKRKVIFAKIFKGKFTWTLGSLS